MIGHQAQYETLLCNYSNHLDAIALLRQHRPYFELIPSLRRPADSLIAVPLPVVKLSKGYCGQNHWRMPCDVIFLMCDPEWKIKTGREVFVFIHRPGEDFSGLIERWRQVEVILGEDYYWLLPWKYHHIMTDKGEYHYPLFVTLNYTPQRIKKGLAGAALPFVSVEVTEFESLSTNEAETAIADRE